MKKVFEHLLKWLEEAKVPYKHLAHAATRTSEESAQARGESLDVGAKAIVMKIDDTFALFVMRASKKVDSKKIKALTHCRSIRFATPEELMELTGLVPGSVPPFGRPILPFTLYIDESIQNFPRVAFNAGSLFDSLFLDTADYLSLCGGTLCSIAK